MDQHGLETIIMLPNELDAIIGKRTKSTNDINQIKYRPCTKSLLQTQYRQSELELIFQVKTSHTLSLCVTLLIDYLLYFIYIETCATKRTKSDVTYFLNMCVCKLKDNAVNHKRFSYCSYYSNEINMMKKNGNKKI